MNPVLKAALIIIPIWLFILAPAALFVFRQLLKHNAEVEYDWADWQREAAYDRDWVEGHRWDR